MKIQARTLFAMLVCLLLSLSGSGQQPVMPDEMPLRINIQREVENGPLDNSSDETRNRVLFDLRNQLLRVLLKKTGALETRIQNLEAPGALPEVLAHAEQLKKELNSVNNDIKALDAALVGGAPTVFAILDILLC